MFQINMVFSVKIDYFNLRFFFQVEAKKIFDANHVLIYITNTFNLVSHEIFFTYMSLF